MKIPDCECLQNAIINGEEVDYIAHQEDGDPTVVVWIAAHRGDHYFGDEIEVPLNFCPKCGKQYKENEE